MKKERKKEDIESKSVLSNTKETNQSQEDKSRNTTIDLMSNVKDNKYAKWEDLTVASDMLYGEEASVHKRSKVNNTIQRYKITTNEVEKWKNRHWTRYDEMVESNTNEYSIIKVIVEEILKDRDKQNERDKEENAFGRLMDLIEENEQTNFYEVHIGFVSTYNLVTYF